MLLWRPVLNSTGLYARELGWRAHRLRSSTRPSKQSPGRVICLRSLNCLRAIVEKTSWESHLQNYSPRLCSHWYCLFFFLLAGYSTKEKCHVVDTCSIRKIKMRQTFALKCSLKSHLKPAYCKNTNLILHDRTHLAFHKLLPRPLARPYPLLYKHI